MNKKLSHYIIFVNTYIRILFRFISLRWTSKHKYTEFINNESKQNKACTTNISIHFISNHSLKKSIFVALNLLKLK